MCSGWDTADLPVMLAPPAVAPCVEMGMGPVVDRQSSWWPPVLTWMVVRVSPSARCVSPFLGRELAGLQCRGLVLVMSRVVQSVSDISTHTHKREFII